jgi:DNA-binding MarR family transcriptional regulator
MQMTNKHSSFNDKVMRQRWLEFVGSLNPTTKPETIRLAGMLHQVGHALRQLGEESLHHAGLSYSQYRILMQLLFHEQFEGGGALNPSEISERQGLSRNTISALIRNLEAERLIERELDQNDRRRFLIRLTDSGRDKVHSHAAGHFQTIHCGFETLTVTEQEAMTASLEKIAQALGNDNRRSVGNWGDDS